MTLIVSILGISMPSFFAAFLLQRLVIALTQMMGQRILPAGGFGWDAHIILPALVLAARPIAQIARVTSGSVSDVYDQDYVRTARGKGLSERRVMEPSCNAKRRNTYRNHHCIVSPFHAN